MKEPLFEPLRREAARGEMSVDLPVYVEAGRDPRDPILLGSGSLQSPLGIFGRDPGRQEILEGEPFIGKGGQLIRAALHRATHGGEPPDLTASVEVGRDVFWGNTVPYKPTGNKAWSVGVKRRFLPLIRAILVEHWKGQDLITCGNVAFFWFGLADPSLKGVLEAHWSRPDRYETSLSITLAGKPFSLHPLPHPSPLNATWYPRFPSLMDLRLSQLGWPP